MAESYGAQAFRAQSPDELRQAMRQGLALADVPTIIEIPMGDVPSTDPFRGLPRIR
jgi:acetolactate synthase-1/2/3 large subunit